MKSKTLQLKIGIALLIGFIAVSNQSFTQQLSAQSAANLVKTNASAIGLSKTDLGNFRISAAYIDKNSGASLVYVQQTYKGVDVFNAVQTYAFKNNRLVSAAGKPIAGMDGLINVKNGKAAVTASNAVNAAAANLRLPSSASLASAKQINDIQEFDFGTLNISSVNVKAKLIWLQDEMVKNALLTWQVEIQPKGVADYWLVNIDAVKGNVISKINLNVVCDWTHPKNAGTIGTNINTTNYSSFDNTADNDALVAGSAKYKVVPFPAESPNHPGGTPVVRTDPWNLAGSGNNATTLKWNSDGTTNFDSTRGNNVLAQEDHNGNNGFGSGAVSTTALPNLTFNFKPNFNNPPTTAVNQNFAITDLFYWNNIMHDISYQYGFDEVSGNFQANNLGRGGAGNDYVFADAQDGSSSNNANFSTPTDGNSPRMQMFLFNAVPVFSVLQPASFAGAKTATESAVSTNNKIADKGPITQKVVLYKDASGTHEACTAPLNATALAGKVALIDRGTCGFAVKILNAQNAGAAAVIVADNIPGEYPIIMGGTDNTIIIPAVMVSFETGDTIKQNLSAHTNVKVSMKKGVLLDGDNDAGVMSHEYTHGISNRLTGGPNNVSCLQNKEEMGEGWSDYMALMVTTNWKTATINDGLNAHPIGTYVLGQGNDGAGIRYYPYSTDLSINPWTYDSLALSSRFGNSILTYDPHVVGEVWSNMLWLMTWDIIQSKGINKNIYNASVNKGNSIALRLVLEGMKLQNCSPGFVDGRNGILKADTLLFGGQYSSIIWNAFASRGLGYLASEGSTNNIKDGIADYSLPPGLLANAVHAEDAIAKNNKLITIAPNPASNKVTLTISGNKRSLNVELINASGQQIKTFSMNGERLDINLPKLASGMYYLKIAGEGFAETRKLIIQ